MRSLMKQIAGACLLGAGLVSASEYDASWMDAYAWTDRYNRLADAPFVLVQGETRPLRFTQTDYITLPSAAHSAPLVLNGIIYLSGGNRLSKMRTAILGGTVEASDDLWVGENNQIVDVTHATVQSVNNKLMMTGSGTTGWSINLYDGAVWKIPIRIQNFNDTVLDPCINVYGGTFAPTDFWIQNAGQHLVHKLTVNLDEGATLDAHCTILGCGSFAVLPGAHVTFQTAGQLRELNADFDFGAGSLTTVVKYNGDGTDANRYKFADGRLTGSGDMRVTEGAGLDFRIAHLADYTGTVTVESGGKIMFPTFYEEMSSTNMTVVFKGGTAGDTSYGDVENRLAYYAGKIEIESWQYSEGFGFGDSPAAVTLEAGAVFAYDNLEDLALLTGGESGGALTVETNATIAVTLPTDAAACPAFLGKRTTFPAEGTAKLQVRLDRACEAVYVLGSEGTAATAGGAALEVVGDAADNVEAALRVENGELQLVVTAPAAVATVEGVTRDADGKAVLKGRLETFGAGATSADLTLEWSTDAAFETVAGRRSLGTFTTLGAFTAPFDELSLPGRVYVRFVTVNNRDVEKVNTAKRVGVIVWRSVDSAATWASSCWDVGEDLPGQFSDGLSVRFDGAERLVVDTIALPQSVQADEMEIDSPRDYVFQDAGLLTVQKLVKKGTGKLTLKQVGETAFALPETTLFAGGRVEVEGRTAREGLLLGAADRLVVTNATVAPATAGGALCTASQEANGVIELWDGADWSLPIRFQNTSTNLFDSHIDVHPGAVFAPASWTRANTATGAFWVRKTTLNLMGGRVGLAGQDAAGCLAVRAVAGTESSLSTDGTLQSFVSGPVTLEETATVRVVKQTDDGPAANRVKIDGAPLAGAGTFVVEDGASLDLRPAFAADFTGRVEVASGGLLYPPAYQQETAAFTIDMTGGGLGTSVYGGTDYGLTYFAGTINISSIDQTRSDTEGFRLGTSSATVNVVAGGTFAYTNLTDLATFTGGEGTGTLNLLAGSTLAVPLAEDPEMQTPFLGARVVYPAHGVATLQVALPSEAALWKRYTLGVCTDARVLPHLRARCVGADGSTWTGSLLVLHGNLVLQPRGGFSVHVR